MPTPTLRSKVKKNQTWNAESVFDTPAAFEAEVKSILKSSGDQYIGAAAVHHHEAPKAVPQPAVSSSRDDLKKIEGIGPKIEELLNSNNIHTYSDLAGTSADAIKAILQEAGPRYQMHNPTTWPQQAGLAADGRWDELERLQAELDGGK